jgi:hypothetical protein
MDHRDRDRGIDPDYAAALLQRQDALQDEAREVVNALDLLILLGRAGQVVPNGSAVAGLMVWRDLDFSVLSPGLSRTAAFELLLPLVAHPDVTQVRYLNQAERFTYEAKPENARYYFTVYYKAQSPSAEPAAVPPSEWKLDISFWLDATRDEAAYTELLMQRLTDETRLAILWIKDIWHTSPLYRTQVGSTDIYTAVLDHGVRTPAEFDAYLRSRGTPTLG